METLVRAHKSHSKKGKIEEVHAHKMHVNERVHERHERRLEQEAEALEELAHKHRRHVKEQEKRHRKLAYA
ncbi:MAG: hypothetical protein QXS81_04730 [Candidatus Micrarchaeaceae archaeon]